MIWIRPHATPFPRVDVAIFDVDGVLIDDSVSYYAAVKATVEYVVYALFGRPAPERVVADADIMAFKTAGGFNDDWVLAYTLCGLILSGAAAGDDALVRIAAQSAGRGRPWIEQAYFPNLGLDFELVRRIGIEHYWGAERLQRYLGWTPQFYHGEGFVQLEKPLTPAGYFEELRALNIRRFGLITGRDDIELYSALKTLRLNEANPFTFMLDSREIRKPDPAALQRAMLALQPQAALYIGDTGDDLRLVLNYRQSAQASVPCLAVIVAKAGQRPQFENAGADIILDAADELPAALIAAGVVAGRSNASLAHGNADSSA